MRGDSNPQSQCLCGRRDCQATVISMATLSEYKYRNTNFWYRIPYLPKNITILESIHRPVFQSKHSTSETRFWPHLQVEPTQLGPIDIVSVSKQWWYWIQCRTYTCNYLHIYSMRLPKITAERGCPEEQPPYNYMRGPFICFTAQK
jgi:hypothetical protein